MICSASQSIKSLRAGTAKEFADQSSDSVVQGSVQTSLASGTPPEKREESHNLSDECLKLFSEWLELWLADKERPQRRPYFRARIKKLMICAREKWLGKSRVTDAAGRKLSDAALVKNRAIAFDQELKRGENKSYVATRIAETESRIGTLKCGTERGTNSDAS